MSLLNLIFKNYIVSFFKKRGIAFKLNNLILVVSSVIFIVALFINYHFTKILLVKDIENQAETIARITAGEIERIFISSEEVAKFLVSIMQKSDLGKNNLAVMLASIVENHQQLYGGSLAFEPYEYDQKIKFYSPYAYETRNGIKVINQLSETTDYTKFPWFSNLKDGKQEYWTEPYREEITKKELITYSVPFFSEVEGVKKLKGVARVDISLKWLSKIIKEIDSSEKFYAMIISKDGSLIYYPFSDKKELDNIFEYAKKNKEQSLEELAREMASGKTNFLYTYVPLLKETAWLYYAPIGHKGWAIALFYPDKELKKNLAQINILMITICLLGIVLLMLLIFFITRKLIGPIIRLTHSVKLIGRGNLNWEIATSNSNDEVGILTRSFKDMQDSLKEYIENLKRTTAEKETYLTELKIASTIQNSILPDITDEFKRDLYELYVKLVPAKDISGDFYDFFYIDNQTIAITVADVSGKGFPAAFFMSMAKFAIKNICNSSKNLTPGEILTVVNELIISEKVSNMFFTCYLVFYNINTGRFRYANAGHHDLIHVLSNGKIEEKGMMGIPPVGFFQKTKYQDQEFILGKGEIVALFTDGIPEASNLEDVQFGNKKINEHFSLKYKEKLSDIGDSLVANVLDFEEHHRFDDITLLILKRN
ncbi:MAG TPA: hypothetical protein DD381_08540 [Lentisphaeria bacterium]|nr:MAG: hypothetical protein A2X47_11145 [Lentisphaerae bacterium GWF2_38_69]HBM16370.1 hypothetical protein [Lentisphaeria bacterium]